MYLTNLLDKDKLTYQKLILRDAKFNFDLEKINKYKKYFSQDINSIDINLYKGSIEFFDEKKYITTLKDINFKYNFSKKTNSINNMGSVSEHHRSSSTMKSFNCSQLSY